MSGVASASDTVQADDALVEERPRAGYRRRFAVTLGAVVALGGVLRLWSITFGVPMVQYPDEPNILNPALVMVAHRDLNPHWFIYPGLIIYAEVAVVVLVKALTHLVSLSAGMVISLEYVLGRLAMAAFGIATVGLVGLVGYRMARRRREVVGLVAAGIVAVSLLLSTDAHYLKPDVPTAFFTALTLWFTLGALEHDRMRDWLLAGVAVGFAASFKYTGLAVALVPAIAMVMMGEGWRGPLHRWRTVLLMAAAAIVVFVVADPGALMTPRTFYQEAIVYNQTHYSTGHPGSEGTHNWLWYLEMLWSTGIGPTLAPLVIVGVLFEAWRSLKRDRVALLLLIFPLLYYLDSSRYVVRFDRQLIPIMPFLALIGARWLDRVPVPRLATTARVGLGALALVAFTVPAIAVARWDIEIGKTDTRYPTLAWVEAHLPKGAVVAREWYTPPLTANGYHGIYIRSAYEQPVSWFDANHVQYLIVSSYMYGRYLVAPEKYPDQAAFYQKLLAVPPLITIEPVGHYTGPTIEVYRVAAVRSRLMTHSVPPPPG
ncbi:MAG TPA: glycosyltransferase family 39 protein [Thermomicrobiaceae bacterium]|nr:glycosyltransferase family 39 protein [Thermomicrobiaceae bacterium]